MSSRADSRKRRVLASHLKASIDVLEDKAREVKRYADALECVRRPALCAPISSPKECELC